MRGWKDGSAVKSLGCSSRWPGFKSQHAYGNSYLSITSIPELLTPSHRQTCKQNTNAHKNKNNFFFKKKSSMPLSNWRNNTGVVLKVTQNTGKQERLYSFSSISATLSSAQCKSNRNPAPNKTLLASIFSEDSKERHEFQTYSSLLLLCIKNSVSHWKSVSPSSRFFSLTPCHIIIK